MDQIPFPQTRVPLTEEWLRAIHCLHQEISIGPSGQERLRELVRRAKRKNDVRELAEFYWSALAYLS
jgi:hypothetical protein